MEERTPLNWARALVKGILLFAALNMLLAVIGPFEAPFGVYNRLVAGRARFPYGENSAAAYNLSLYDLGAMFAAHELDGAGAADGEFRVLVLGDSSVWGTLLRPEETLSGQLNALGLRCGGKPARFYNLGYPTLSLAKDLMILREGMGYQPDLILWPLTLESFPRGRQLESPLAANNADRLGALARETNLPLAVEGLAQPTFWERTLIGRRRPAADWLRLQLYGFAWAATGVDQDYPDTYEPAARDLEADPAYHDWLPPTLPLDELAFELLLAGMAEADGTPLVLINEPILVSGGQNSDIRYNFYYPRWAYDQYREMLAQTCQANGWTCLDAWDRVPPERFTNTAIHMDTAGERLFAEFIYENALAGSCQKP